VRAMIASTRETSAATKDLRLLENIIFSLL
jgi:hypothetical protein